MAAEVPVPGTGEEIGGAALTMPQPENQGAWANATKGLLGNAKSVTDDLFNALNEKDNAPAKIRCSPSDKVYKNPGPKNKADLDAQLSVCRFASNQVDIAIQRVCNSRHALGFELQKKWAPLKVCEWRIALRARRPTRELFRDHVQDALEKEQQFLLEARVKLGDLAKEGVAILEDCEANKARLVRIVRCMVCLGSAKVPPLPADNSESVADPSSPSSPPPEGVLPLEGEDAAPQVKAKPVVPSDAPGLLKRAPQLEELVLGYVSQSEALIKSQKSRCERARDQVLVCFKKRWTENEVVKKSLDQQIQQMNEAIVSAEKSLAVMKKRIDFFGELDFVPKYDAATVILAKLRESKAQLEDDFHHKLVSMKIDEACRKITSERATGVDPMSLPVAAMLEGPAHRKKAATMNRNNSSPAFVGGELSNNTIRPPSPAGVSSPLKAAVAASLA